MYVVVYGHEGGGWLNDMAGIPTSLAVKSRSNKATDVIISCWVRMYSPVKVLPCRHTCAVENRQQLTCSTLRPNIIMRSGQLLLT